MARLLKNPLSYTMFAMTSQQPIQEKKKNFIASIIETLRIAFWGVSQVYKIAKIEVILKFTTKTLTELSSVFYNGILTIIIDYIIQISNKGSFTIENIIFIVGIYILYNTIFFTAVRTLENVVSGNIRIKLRFLPRELLHNKLNEIGAQNLENPEVLNKVTRFRENSYAFEQILEIFSSFIGLFVTALVSGIVVVSISPILLVIIIIISIPRFRINQILTRRFWKLEKDTTDENRISDGNVGYLITPSSLKEVKMTNAYKDLRKYWDSFSKMLIAERIRIRRNWGISIYFVRFLDAILYAITFIRLLELLVAKVISTGQVLFLMSNVSIFNGSFSAFITTLADLDEISIRMKEMKELLEFNDNQTNGTQTIELEKGPEIKFDKVSFSYPNSEKLIYKNLNLTINPGEKVAIIGHNGAGKTTLVKLISKIYKPTKGKITINGQDLNELQQDSWYQNLGVLFQDFNGYEHQSVRGNVVIGTNTENIDDAKVWKALKDADAEEFVKEYPAGLDTILSEKYKDGIRPSSGQWQKIAIARFFYRNAPVLILDEPTASIDAVAEANIFDRIYKFIENKTVLIISHRFSTVRNADRIIVIEKGKIIEEGTHEQLMQNEGPYAKAFNLQARGYG